MDDNNTNDVKQEGTINDETNSDELGVNVNIEPTNQPYNNNLEINDINNKIGTVSMIPRPNILSTANSLQTPQPPQQSFQPYQQSFQPYQQPPQQTQSNQVPKTKQKSSSKTKEPTVWEFDRPNPWTKITYNENDEYPYYFFIKLKIPSLNDFETWKQIIPNIKFDPTTGELIIPSKEEASALALANLISINFIGQMSIQNILDKNLIQISVAKAKAHELVQNKLREQIMENIYGKSFTKIQNNFEKDLAKNGIETRNLSIDLKSVPVSSVDSRNGDIDFKSEHFSDTFMHFANESKSNDIDAYTGSDYSYL